MVIGRNNGVVGLTGFSDKKMSGLLFGPRKSGRNNGVVVRRGSTVLSLPYDLFRCKMTFQSENSKMLAYYSDTILVFGCPKHRFVLSCNVYSFSAAE